MHYRSETPFDNIEGSHEYVALLEKAIQETITEVQADVELATAEREDRRKEALQIVLFNLNKLAGNMHSSRRILNDLRTLRRLLLDERRLEKVYRKTAGKS